MKNTYYILYLCFTIILISSCSTPKNITYFQDAELIRGMAVQEEQQFRLRPEDKINIIVNSADPMLESQFTLTAQGQRNILGAKSLPETTAGRNNNSSSTAIAYTVDDQGDINFPVLGKIQVIGKTRTEVADFISRRLIERDLVKDPIVTVEYVNVGINILGEVNKPGHIDVTKDHFTIIDAIAYAGDLTINGKRDNILVSRHVDGEDQTYIIDLTNRQDLLQSPAFYLQQNDVIYVSPNKKRIREATGSGNSLVTPSFWISLASLLTTISALLLR